MKSIGGGLRGQEKAKCGNLQDWIKGKLEKQTTLTLVGPGQFTVNIYSMEGCSVGSTESFCGLCSGACGDAFEGPEKEITLTLQRYVILDA